METLVGLPILLGLGLGAVQFALVFQAKHALNHALIEAARAGSVAHAEPDAILRGFASGLMPWLYGARDLGEYAENQARAAVHLAEARARGWLLVEQVSPGPASFDDWAEPARDTDGGVIDGVREIPNDNLVHRATRGQPAGGNAGLRSGEPIGSASGQTLADANLLRLRVDYGVPLAVPVVGRMIAWSLRAWNGCEAARPRRYGLLSMDAPPQGREVRAWTCAMYGADAPGARPRLPVRLTASLRMQSPARHTGAALAGVPVAAASGTSVQRGGAQRTPDPAVDPQGSRGGDGGPRVSGGTSESTGQTPSPSPSPERDPTSVSPPRVDAAFCTGASG